MSMLETKGTVLTLSESLSSVGYSTASPYLLRGLKRRAVVWGMLSASDIAAAVLSVIIVQAISGALFLNAPGPEFSLPILAVIALYAILGHYTEWGISPVERMRIRALGSIAYIAFSTTLIAASDLSFATIGNVAATGILLFIIGHYLEYIVRKSLIRLSIWGVPTILIGSHQSQDLAKVLLEQPDFGLKPIGIVSDYENTYPKGLSTHAPGFNHPDNMRSSFPDAEIALVMKDQINNIDRLRHLPFEHIILVNDMKGALSIGIHAKCTGEWLGDDLQRGIYKRRNLLIKRAFDLLVSIPVAILTAPLILVLLLIIKIVDPGPGLFWQGRIGQYGRTIKVCKLRTMYLDAEQQLESYLSSCPAAREEWDTHFKLQNDPRILPVIGHFIRRYSLDELPQIFNVLQGSISLVGPRPFPEYHLKSFDEDFQDLRTSVPPGLTGYWQISARSDGNLSVQKSQDTLYVQNWSPWLDLWILLQTVPAVLAAKGAR